MHTISATMPEPATPIFHTQYQIRHNVGSMSFYKDKTIRRYIIYLPSIFSIKKAGGRFPYRVPTACCCDSNQAFSHYYLRCPNLSFKYSTPEPSPHLRSLSTMSCAVASSSTCSRIPFKYS